MLPASEQHIQELLQKHGAGTANDGEYRELFHAIQSQPGLLKRISEGIVLPDHTGAADMDTATEEAILQAIFATGISDTPVKPVHRVHFLKTAWFRYAAILLLITGLSAYLYTSSFRRNHGVIARHEAENIVPGANKATLTLADGSTILLDNVANGQLAQQGSTTVIKLTDGELSYNPEQKPSRLVPSAGLNTITTPKGGQYQVTLPDGTKVWLNAASSIRFPTAFTYGERKVQVTGEAYFEIKTDAKRPFKVMTFENRKIEVLGTSFNVNAYAEEPFMKTTLVEGSIKVSIDNQSQILQPGQQAVVNNTGNTAKLAITKKTDLQQVLAWKNGAFNFEGAKLPEVMRQIERWYDVTVLYEKQMPDIEFGGKMRRSTPLSGIISALGQMGIHCRLEGRSLIISP